MAVANGVDGSPIAIRGLSKSYGRIVAVGGIDLTVNAGDIYGFTVRVCCAAQTDTSVCGLTRDSACGT